MGSKKEPRENPQKDSQAEEIRQQIIQKIEDMKKEATSKGVWRNAVIAETGQLSLRVAVSPSGVVMLQLCGQKPGNCLNLGSKYQVEELFRMMELIAEVKMKLDIIKELMSSGKQKAGVEYI